MSYIRNTSNPEKLYIYNSDDIVYFCKGSIDVGTMPLSIWEGLLKKYKKERKDITFKNASIKEIFKNRNYKQRISFDNWNLDIWECTLDSIILDFKIKKK